MKKISLEYSLTIREIVDLNPNFALAKCLICYTGQNRKNTVLSKDVLEDALPTLKNIPIVGKFDLETDDFKGHAFKLVQKDGENKLYADTFPFGLIPESANQWWEDIMINGEKREALWTDVILWKRQFGYEAIASSDKTNQSMEIDVVDYEKVDGIFIVKKIIFKALCLLGKDIAPVFEGAHVEMTYSEEALTLSFGEMLEQLQTYSEESMDKIIKTDEDVQIEEQDPVVEEVTEEVVEPASEEPVEQEDAETEKPAEVEEEPAAETEDPEETEEDPAAETEAQEDSEEPAAETENEDTTDESEDSDPSGEYSETEAEVVDYETLYKDLKVEHENYVRTHSYWNEDVEGYQRWLEDQNKRANMAARSAIYEKFDKLMLDDNTAYIDLKKDAEMYDYSATEVENQCYTILGKQAAIIAEKAKADAPAIIAFSLEGEPEKESDNEPYGGIMRRYLHK